MCVYVQEEKEVPLSANPISLRQAAAESESGLQSPNTAPYGACWPMECRYAGKIFRSLLSRALACCPPCTPGHVGRWNKQANLWREWSGLQQVGENRAKCQ